MHWKRNKAYIHLIHLMLAGKRLQIWVFMMQSKAVVVTGFSRQISHGFWVSVGVSVRWYREYVKNCNVAINWRHANWLQDCKLTILRPTGLHKKPVHWGYQVIRVSVFGTSPIGYQRLVHGSPTWSPPESNLCIRNFCPVNMYVNISYTYHVFFLVYPIVAEDVANFLTSEDLICIPASFGVFEVAHIMCFWWTGKKSLESLQFCQHIVVNTFGQRAMLLALSLSVRVQHSSGHQGRWNEAALCSTKSS